MLTVLLALACAGCPLLLKDDFAVSATAATDDGGGDGLVDGSDADADAGTDGGSCSSACGVGRTCIAGKCTPEWVPTSAPPAAFVGRQQAAVCSMGSKVFIWGGALLANGSERQDGVIYDPTTDTWTPISTTNAPTARVGATCAWNGTVILVFGGGDLAASQDLNTGGRYNPSTNTWQAIVGGGPPPARRRAFTAWSGTHFVVFGGENKSGGAMKDAFRYDPVGDSWDAKAGGAPPGATGQAISLVGADMLVFGGLAASELSTLDAFSVSTNAWSSPSNTNAPTARLEAFAAAAGTKWVVWGGASASTPKSDGNRYDAAGKSWLGATSAASAPSARRMQNLRAGWAFSAGTSTVAIVGGRGVSDAFEKNGGLYDVAADAWTAIPAWPSGANHEWGAAAMTDTELVVWSGLDGTTITSAGERWLRP